MLQVPEMVFLFGISRGGITGEADMAASGDMAHSQLPAGEKRWLLRKAGALNSHNLYSEARQEEVGVQMDCQLQDGRVLQELVRSGDIWLIQASGQAWIRHINKSCKA